MQSFYSHFNSHDTITINTGSGLASVYTKRSDSYLTSSVVRDCINGKSKSGKCYFCSYISNIHLQKHTSTKGEAALGTFKLTPVLEGILNS